MSSNSSDSAPYLPVVGQIVPRYFSAGFVALSYLVSWIGAWTTLELLNKRTAARGLYNWYLLVASSISMGGIAIWSMHFIGNRAVVLGDGSPNIQIAYSQGFTALSFFVPIIVLLCTFLGLGAMEKVSWPRVTIAGIFAGAAICGMHYLGQLSIANYTCVYQEANIVGAAIIAEAASIIALAVFFTLRAAWTHSWWKRALTALILAGAVSGMHFTASVGNQYRLKQVSTDAGEDFSNTFTVVVVIIFCIMACLTLIAFTLVAQRRRAQAANRAQEVVLAAAIFDSEGKLMVTREGQLPSQKITNEYLERSFNDIFGVSHPVFQWLFRTSHNWPAISGLIPAMRNHIEHLTTPRSRSGTRRKDIRLTNEEGNPIDDYSVIFRELFCIAAADLAAQLHEPLENLGALYDEILNTGQTSKSKNRSKFRKSLLSSIDIEHDEVNLPVFGRGQLLFTVRHVNRRGAEALQAAGFRFASTNNVLNILANSMQINSEDLDRKFTMMKKYARCDDMMLEPGVHLACFAIRACIGGGFDILVNRTYRNQLPTMQLPVDGLDEWRLRYLQSLDGSTVSNILDFLKDRPTNSGLKREQDFARRLYETLVLFCKEIEDPAFQDAMLIFPPIWGPCRDYSEHGRPGRALYLTFRLMIPVHSPARGSKFEFIPISFFRTQQQVYKGSPDHDGFARKIHREFGPILSQAAIKAQEHKNVKSPLTSSFTRKSENKGTFWGRKSTSDQPRPTSNKSSHGSVLSPKVWERHTERGRQFFPSGIASDAASEQVLVDNRAFGGILVSQEISVISRRDRTAKQQSIRSSDSSPTRVNTSDVEMIDLEAGAVYENGGKTEVDVSMDSEDPITYVDQLFAICSAAKNSK